MLAALRERSCFFAHHDSNPYFPVPSSFMYRRVNHLPPEFIQPRPLPSPSFTLDNRASFWDSRTQLEHLQLPDEHNLAAVLSEASKILETRLPNEAARTVVHNSIQVVMSVFDTYYGDGSLSHSEESGLKATSASLKSALSRIREAIEVPDNSKYGEVTQEVVNATANLLQVSKEFKIPSLIHDSYSLKNLGIRDYQLDSRCPLVIHPYLDLAMRYLRETLVLSLKTFYNGYLEGVVYFNCMSAFIQVNEHLFAHPGPEGLRKAETFTRILNEVRREFRDHSITYESDIASWWLFSWLIAPHRQWEFCQILLYVAETVSRITGKELSIDEELVQRACDDDTKMLTGYWESAMAAAVTCFDLRTCEAVEDFPRWARTLVHDNQDIETAQEAYRRAWKLMKDAAPSTYCYRVLKFANLELRRNLLNFIQEWEFLDSEITIESRIGQGGFGEVFTCSWLGGKAAVKCLKKANDSGSDRLSRTLAAKDLDTHIHRGELEYWFRLSHDHILPFLGACITSNPPMILTHLATNGSARSFISNNPRVDLIKMFSDISSGLRYLHAASGGIVHGDLKGANILIGDHEEPLIADFGLAKMVQNVYGTVERTGGTAHWMAPELFLGKPLTLASDIYALGMTFYELWYDKDPFGVLEPDLVEPLVVEDGGRPEPDNESEKPPVPSYIWILLQSCWSQEADQRPSASHVYQRLQAIRSVPAAPLEGHLRGFGVYAPAQNSKLSEDSQEEDSHLPCSHLHDEPSILNRTLPILPFDSSGYLISISSRQHPTQYVFRGSYVVLDSSLNFSPRTDTQTVSRIIFRTQSQASHHPKRIGWGYPQGLQTDSFLEAYLLRNVEGADGNRTDDWKEVEETKTVLLKNDEKCTSKVMHVFVFGADSAVCKYARHGDRITLGARLDSDAILEVLRSEIEVQMYSGEM